MMAQNYTRQRVKNLTICNKESKYKVECYSVQMSYRKKLTNVMATKGKFINYLITGHMEMKICHI